jgi:hypothetical protein
LQINWERRIRIELDAMSSELNVPLSRKRTGERTMKPEAGSPAAEYPEYA